nr:hypothetical protein BaRGS_030447 [Batillaria attramentaria]
MELRKVDLSYNLLETLPSVAATAKKKLHTLLLAGNKLTDISGIDDMDSLVVLDLSENHISSHSRLVPVRQLHRLEQDSVDGGLASGVPVTVAGKKKSRRKAKQRLLEIADMDTSTGGDVSSSREVSPASSPRVPSRLEAAVQTRRKEVRKTRQDIEELRRHYGDNWLQAITDQDKLPRPAPAAEMPDITATSSAAAVSTPQRISELRKSGDRKDGGSSFGAESAGESPENARLEIEKVEAENRDAKAGEDVDQIVKVRMDFSYIRKDRRQRVYVMEDFTTAQVCLVWHGTIVSLGKAYTSVLMGNIPRTGSIKDFEALAEQGGEKVILMCPKCQSDHVVLLESGGDGKESGAATTPTCVCQYMMEDEYNALVVITNMKMYILRINTDDVSVEPKDALTCVEIQPLAELKRVEVGLGRQTIRLEFTTDCSSYTLIMRNEEKVEAFLERLSDHLKAYAMETDIPMSTVFDEEVDQNTLDNLSADVLQRGGQANSLRLYVLGYIARGHSLQYPIAFVVSDSEICLTRHPSKKHLMRITFFNESSGEETNWLITMEIEKSIVGLIDAIRQPWEEAFGVEMDVETEEFELCF